METWSLQITSRVSSNVRLCYMPRAFVIAQLAKNLPAMQETGVQFLGWEDSLEKEMATHSSVLA